jgi:hypothetical protein
MYASSASHLMSADELVHLLRQSRENNTPREITGMLLYSDGNFLQVLEGPDAAVDRLLKTIERDSRHKGMMELLRGELTERQFAEWSMGFRNVAELAPEDRAVVSDFLERPFPDSGTAAVPHESLKLLRVFHNLMS